MSSVGAIPHGHRHFLAKGKTPTNAVSVSELGLQEVEMDKPTPEMASKGLTWIGVIRSGLERKGAVLVNSEDTHFT
jgi:hypothetical protein